MNLNELDTVEVIIKYIFQRQSILTLHNEETNTHFTFKFIQAQKPTRDVYWAFVLTMPDNTDKKSYKFVGAFSKQKGFKYSKSAQIKQTSQSCKTMCWFFKHLNDGTLKQEKFSSIKVYKSSNCHDCDRLLTHPDSLKYGHGAECGGKRIRDGTKIISDKDLPISVTTKRFKDFDSERSNNEFEVVNSQQFSSSNLQDNDKSEISDKEDFWLDKN